MNHCADCPSADICTEWNSQSPPEPAACVADLVLVDADYLQDRASYEDERGEAWAASRGTL